MVISEPRPLPATGPPAGRERVEDARRTRRLLWPAGADLLLLAGLGVAALLLRLPYLQTAPGFSDEVDEILHSLRILQGEPLLLTNYDPYDGSLWNYLVAAALWLSGGSLYAPRTVALIFGVLTVLATYPLGRAWSGGSRLGGLLAAGLLAANPVHIALNSHVAWGNCITPLFTTLGILALRSGGGDGGRETEGGGSVGPRSGLRTQDSGLAPGLRTQDSGVRTAALVGLAWGLAFQTHPSVLTLLPGIAAYLAVRRPGLLRGRWVIVAGLVFLAVNLNLLIYNFSSGLGSVQGAVAKSAEYAYDRKLTAELYLGRLRLLGIGLVGNLSGAVEVRDDSADLLDPGLWPILPVVLGGLVLQWRRGNPLPVLLLIGTAALLPLLNGNFRPIMDGRYLVPLLPPFFAAVGGLAVVAAGRQVGGGRAAVWGLRLALVVLFAFLLLRPLGYLQAFYDHAAQGNKTNDHLFRVLDTIGEQRGRGEIVLIDQVLENRKLAWSDGRVARVLRLAFGLRGLPYQVADFEGDQLLKPAARCENRLVIVAARGLVANEALITRLDLRDMDHRPARPGPQFSGFRLLRLDRLAGEPGVCPPAARGT